MALYFQTALTPGAGSGDMPDALAVWRKLLLLGAAGAALPWLVVVLLTAAQAGAPQVAEPGLVHQHVPRREQALGEAGIAVDVIGQ